MRDDSVGLDTHRNFIYFVSQPMAAHDRRAARLRRQDGAGRRPSPRNGTPRPTSRPGPSSCGAAPSSTTARPSTPQAIKWNIERILDPKIGHSFTRSALTDVERVTVDDKHTVRFHLKERERGASTPTSSTTRSTSWRRARSTTADTHPVGCGPFKFKSWKRFDTCELVRFENFWETDAEGNSLPYLDGMIGKPKKEDRVRLTALRTNEVDLIDNVAYADAPNFIKEHGRTYDTWLVPQVGTAFIAFNLKNGPFSEKDNPDAHLLRRRSPTPSTTRASTRRYSTSRARSPRASTARPARGTARTSRRWPQFDPDKAKALRKKAKGGDAKLLIIANDSFPYMQQSGELAHAMLKDAGFDVTFEIHPDAGDPGQVQQGRRSIWIRRPTPTASIPTAGTRARSCRRRPRPCAATATRTRRSTS